MILPKFKQFIYALSELVGSLPVELNAANCQSQLQKTSGKLPKFKTSEQVMILIDIYIIYLPVDFPKHFQ